MKKKLSCLLCFVLVISLLTVPAMAGDEELYEPEKITFYDDLLTGSAAMVQIVNRNSEENKELAGEDYYYVENCVIVGCDEDILFDTTHVIEGVRYNGIYYLRYDTVENAKEAVNAFEQNEKVKYAETDMLFSIDGELNDMPTFPFYDVIWGAYYIEAIYNLNAEEIMTGYGLEGSTIYPIFGTEGYSGIKAEARRFGVGDTMKRCDFATIVYRYYGNGEKAADPGFADVNMDSYYGDAVAWMKEKGYITGYNDETFGTNDPITREQMVTILWRVAGEPEVEGSLENFKDSETVSGFAYDAMLWATGTGVITGTEEGYLIPKTTCTREMAATIFYRTIKDEIA